MGCVVYGLLHGEFPFGDEADVCSKKVTAPKGTPSECIDFLKSLLEKKESARVDSAQAMASAWIAGYIADTDAGNAADGEDSGDGEESKMSIASHKWASAVGKGSNLFADRAEKVGRAWLEQKPWHTMGDSDSEDDFAGSAAGRRPELVEPIQDASKNSADGTLNSEESLVLCQTPEKEPSVSTVVTTASFESVISALEPDSPCFSENSSWSRIVYESEGPQRLSRIASAASLSSSSSHSAAAVQADPSNREPNVSKMSSFLRLQECIPTRRRLTDRSHSTAPARTRGECCLVWAFYSNVLRKLCSNLTRFANRLMAYPGGGHGNLTISMLLMFLLKRIVRRGKSKNITN